ncbi:MAG: heme o synthase [Desulfurococcales archaeon]|nr:heme o synthase [Desulfurococcales archaeon]
MDDKLGKIKSLIQMTKPRQLILLLVTMYGAYFAAGGSLDPVSVGLLTITGFGSVGGVTALNMYLERDIDSMMKRTRKRPLPSGKLSDREALAGITIMILVGIIAAALINKYVAFAVLAGLYFDIIAYTELTKRSTAWNLVLGSFAGSMPALGGWAAGEGAITLGGLLLAGIVFFWQPMHVSFLAYYFREDYRRAGIPTVPDVLSTRAFSLFLAVSIGAIPVLLWAYMYIEGYGLFTSIITSAMAFQAILKVLDFSRHPSKSTALNMIKFASPLIAIAFLGIPVERMLS